MRNCATCERWNIGTSNTRNNNKNGRKINYAVRRSTKKNVVKWLTLAAARLCVVFCTRREVKLWKVMPLLFFFCCSVRKWPTSRFSSHLCCRWKLIFCCFGFQWTLVLALMQPHTTSLLFQRVPRFARAEKIALKKGRKRGEVRAELAAENVWHV